MTAEEIREKYLKFFEKEGHKVIPSSSLVPENDPTVLFTTAGMHPLVPYLLGEKHPLGNRLVSCQKCVRTGDIDEVGDATHLTFFEMLGNWSLGDPSAPDGIGAGYFKKGAIEWSFKFLTKELNIPLEKLAVSVFAGDQDASRDEESAKIWQGLDIPKERIAYLPKADNWWGPAGKTGPCGPDTEIFYWTGEEPAPKEFDPNDKRWVEIWNDVFMEYEKKLKMKNEKIKTTIQNSKLNEDEYEFVPLKQKNVDTGMGLERMTAILQGKDNVYETELFEPILRTIKKLSKEGVSNGRQKELRQIADHIKAATFILAERLEPSNIEHGYILRRLLRRAIRNGKFFELQRGFTADVAKAVINIYQDVYPELADNSDFIFEQIQKEEARFEKPLSRLDLYRDDLQMAIEWNVIKKINNIPILRQPGVASGRYVFENYQSFGVPPDLSEEIVKELGLEFDRNEFTKAIQEHQELSRTASTGQFKSGLADNSEATTRYHTATHLLLAALRIILGPEVEQRGSNITAQRLRFDFSLHRKMTDEEIKNVENLVNQKIKDNLPVLCEEMETKKAKEQGAVGVFGHKYGDRVKVYTISDFSKEICAGPHIQNTEELGVFKIIKEEASSQGVRRIRAVLH